MTNREHLPHSLREALLDQAIDYLLRAREYRRTDRNHQAEHAERSAVAKLQELGPERLSLLDDDSDRAE